MIFTLIIIMGIAGAGMYVFKLRADNATLKTNQIKLEHCYHRTKQTIRTTKNRF